MAYRSTIIHDYGCKHIERGPSISVRVHADGSETISTSSISLIASTCSDISAFVPQYVKWVRGNGTLAVVAI